MDPILIRVGVGWSFPLIDETRLMRMLTSEQCDFLLVQKDDTGLCTAHMESGLRSGQDSGQSTRPYAFCSGFASTDPSPYRAGSARGKVQRRYFFFPRPVLENCKCFLVPQGGLLVDYIPPIYVAIVHKLKKGT